ncbi:hypothetical protein [Gloeocapsopsis dulcis]|uniref:Alpha/beta hydrolase n=1 Tax=Gloeocapsopsis dulcis AAB1 = 1H9 TaxID=1433147 RepID=A0A6N8FQT7_9CHRO|nr:hypothetical protein [Gloeocapsopsis dulcis]MUL35381.1 hypothetical protein [Gloeocapsopsis dulcis AAB1 = 1H9]WNN90418.1 hypothetical protein P0S91_04840 [Gloeocapsopsis dulcis]
MLIVICPGIHAPELTQEFVQGLNVTSSNTYNFLISPTHDYAVLSPHLLQFLQAHLSNPQQRSLQKVVFIAFSAGVVGAISAANVWQSWGGQVLAFIAIDGWGVPLFGNFPLHRLSHDYFTHWSSVMLGSGSDNFYAEPAVDHLTLWRSPQNVFGCYTKNSQTLAHLTAAEFLIMLLEQYGEVKNAS